MRASVGLGRAMEFFSTSTTAVLTTAAAMKNTAPQGRPQSSKAPVIAVAMRNAGQPAPTSWRTSEGIVHPPVLSAATRFIQARSTGRGAPLSDMPLTSPKATTSTSEMRAAAKATFRWCPASVTVPANRADCRCRRLSARVIAMADTSEKAVLHRYLRAGREAILWKLDGLSEYDVRRPLVPTGTNLLGLVKHLAGVEAGYFGETFARPFPED